MLPSVTFAASVLMVNATLVKEEEGLVDSILPLSRQGLFSLLA